MTFDDLGLSPEVLKAIQEVGYTTPTPIQEKAIPFVLMGRDLLGSAQTGTGKTASFTVPMIEILATGRARARMPRSLIIAPTRELAAQVGESFERYGKYSKLSKALLIGGSSFVEQEKNLDRGVDVLIATPGRLLDLFERGKILLADVKILVIDEADRMLDMGFIPDVERIVKLLPKIRQTLFFSATMPPEIKRLADAFLMNPKEVSVSPPSTAAANVSQRLLRVSGVPKDKRAALRAAIRSVEMNSALIFCNRKRDVGVVHRSLERHGFSAAALHGDMSQPARMETLAKFKDSQVQIMVCSDVAARGLDIPAVSHVFNFDVPSHSEDYIHRIGRTGRAGREGMSITLASPEDSKSLAGVTRLIGRQIEEISLDDVAAPSGGGERDEGRSDGRSDRSRRRGRGGQRNGRSRSDERETRSQSDERASRSQSDERASRSQSDGGETRSQSEGREEKPPREERQPSQASAEYVEGSEQPDAPETNNDRPVREERAAREDRPTREDRPARDDRKSDRQRGGRKRNDSRHDEARPSEGNGLESKPFGDHTPAFMLRSVPVPKAA